LDGEVLWDMLLKFEDQKTKDVSVLIYKMLAGLMEAKCMPVAAYRPACL
jgi:hypothetical protein